MNLQNIGLKAIAYASPDEFISSENIENQLQDLYTKLKLPFGRIEMQTGIKSRGLFYNKKPSDIATLAAKKIFASKEFEAESIDLLIHASVCRDFLEPSTASVIHSNLKLRDDCISFDLSNACLGVVNAITVASQMINSGSIKNALIVTGENSEPLLRKTIETLKADDSITRKSIKKYFANFTIGSAGVALVISNNVDSLANFTSALSLSDSSAHTLCQGDGNTESLVMETDSELLMQKGVALASRNWNNFKSLEKTTNCFYDHFICHQVGIHHRDFLYKSLELDISKDQMSFDRFGNTGSAALPLTLALAVEKKAFKKHDKIAMLGIGSGIHTLMMGMKWN